MPTPIETLADLGFPQYIKAFHENDITEDLVADLTDADLREMGVQSIGHRKRILAALKPSPLVPSLASSLTERVSDALTESQQPLRIGGDEVIADISWRANIRAWWFVGAAVLLPLLATAASLATAQPGATWSLER